MSNKEEDKLYYDKQKERIELFIKYNYNNVKDITFTKIKKNPMGGLFFYGYLNNDTDTKFSATVSVPGKDFENELSINGKFSDDNYKNLNKDWTKPVTVSEILEEEK